MFASMSALGDDEKVSVIAQWPNGLREEWDNLTVDFQNLLREGTGKAK